MANNGHFRDSVLSESDKQAQQLCTQTLGLPHAHTTMKQLASMPLCLLVLAAWLGSGVPLVLGNAVFAEETRLFSITVSLFFLLSGMFLRHLVYSSYSTQLGYIVPVHIHFQAYALLLFSGLLLRWVCDLGSACIFAAFSSLGFLLGGILPYLALRDPLYFSGCLSSFLFTAYLTGLLFPSLQASVFLILAGLAYSRLNGWCVSGGLPLLNLDHLQGSTLDVAA